MSTLNIPQNIGTNTDRTEFNHDIGTNTPNYAEQMVKALENGNQAEEIVQMLMQSIQYFNNRNNIQFFSYKS